MLKQVSSRYSFTVAHQNHLYLLDSHSYSEGRVRLNVSCLMPLSTAFTKGCLEVIQLLNFMTFTWLCLEPQSKRWTSNDVPMGWTHSYFFLWQEVHLGKSQPVSWGRASATCCLEQLTGYHATCLQPSTQASRATNHPAYVSLAEHTGTNFLLSFVWILFPAIQKSCKTEFMAGLDHPYSVLPLTFHLTASTSHRCHRTSDKLQTSQQPVLL